MINTCALSLTCKYLNNELKEPEINKLKKQKHAAHSMCYRLRKKITTLELTNKLLTLCWISITHENRTIREHISDYIKEVRENDDSNNLSL